MFHNNSKQDQHINQKPKPGAASNIATQEQEQHQDTRTNIAAQEQEQHNTGTKPGQHSARTRDAAPGRPHQTTGQAGTGTRSKQQHQQQEHQDKARSAPGQLERDQRISARTQQPGRSKISTRTAQQNGNSSGTLDQQQEHNTRSAHQASAPVGRPPGILSKPSRAAYGLLQVSYVSLPTNRVFTDEL